MAAQAIDRASQRVVLGGFMRAPHSAWALAEPKARSIFRFPCVRCVVEKEAWLALASEENGCKLHWQRNVTRSLWHLHSWCQAAAVAGENSLATTCGRWPPRCLMTMKMSCADWTARMYVRHLYQACDLYVRTSVCLWDRCYTYVYLPRFRPLYTV